jgi:hypothetical protein
MRTAPHSCVRGLHYTRRCGSPRLRDSNAALTFKPEWAAVDGIEEPSEKDRTPSALGSARMCALAAKARRGRTEVEAAADERTTVTHAREAAG